MSLIKTIIHLKWEPIKMVFTKTKWSKKKVKWCGSMNKYYQYWAHFSIIKWLISIYFIISYFNIIFYVILYLNVMLYSIIVLHFCLFFPMIGFSHDCLIIEFTTFLYLIFIHLKQIHNCSTIWCWNWPLKIWKSIKMILDVRYSNLFDIRYVFTKFSLIDKVNFWIGYIQNKMKYSIEFLSTIFDRYTVISRYSESVGTDIFIHYKEVDYIEVLL